MSSNVSDGGAAKPPMPPPPPPPPPPPTEAAAAAATTTATKKGGGHSVVRNLVSRIRGSVKTSLAVVGAVAVLAAYQEYRTMYPRDDDDDDKGESGTGEDGVGSKKKRVLLLPFHRMELISKKKKGRLRSLTDGGVDWENPQDSKIKIETRELVDVLHAAASDPSIVAVYGMFGHGGGGIASAGFGDLEEIRNALRVVRESHRRHPEPNVSYQMQVIPSVDSKPMYAYTDTFASMADPANKEYYLASIFTHIHMQKQGELNLFGLMSTHFFLRNFLEKYGIQVHVFKHGQYKNAPNLFTESTYTKPHRENVKNVLTEMNNDICNDITLARTKALLTSWLVNSGGSKKSKSYKKASSRSNRKSMTSTSSTKSTSFSSPAATMDLWKRIHDSGTFPAMTAWKGGLVDYLPHRDPFHELVESNKTEQDQHDGGSGGRFGFLKNLFGLGKTKNESAGKNPSDDDVVSVGNTVGSDGASVADPSSSSNPALSTKDAIKASWGTQETDFNHFSANEAITLKEYAKKIARKKAAKKRREQYSQLLQWIGWEKADETVEGKKKEAIALLNVNGIIGDSKARKLIRTIRKIRKDEKTKCVVVRVSSSGGTINACESILQEMKALKVPVVFSFGNVSASGGYYIASHADRIFANKKTITGSIGVFAVRMDLTGFLASYGIKVNHVAVGDLAAQLSPFAPMTNKMKENLAGSIDRYYDQFKSVVSDGRNMTLDDVENIAKGRVYTGEQAKTNGLVDEIGGLHRALAYANRTYTSAMMSGTEVEVVEWPKEGWREKFLDAKEAGDLHQLVSLGRELLSTAIAMVGTGSNSAPVDRRSQSDVNYMVNGLVDKLLHSPTSASSLPGTLGGVLLTADENSAIRLLLDEATHSTEEEREESSSAASSFLCQDFWV